MKKNESPAVIRHGDVVFKRVDKIPAKAQAVNHNGRIVVAEGETTGHNHVLSVENPATMKAYRDANQRLVFNLSAPASIVHPEHGLLHIPAGTYLEDREQEMDWFTKTTQQVID